MIYCLASANLVLCAIIVWQYFWAQDLRFERDYAEFQLRECKARPATRVYDDGTISVEVQVVAQDQQ